MGFLSIEHGSKYKKQDLLQIKGNPCSYFLLIFVIRQITIPKGVASQQSSNTLRNAILKLQDNFDSSSNHPAV